MPVYQYQCPDGHEFERFYRYNEKLSESPRCPECKKESRKVFTANPIHFKGSGWGGKG